ncbi:transmembrane protein 41A-like [Diadema antillarum]|uniref:transmembrane protein 41A-like n=1 Tax=Diadema antillarum TaxID=105358 RepID=UPI003A8727AB
MGILISISAIGSIFMVATSWLYILSINYPSQSSNSSHVELGFPSNLEELKDTVDLLQQYKSDNVAYIMLLFCSAYLYKQTFAIPGSVFMNLLGGALFGTWLAFPLCCLLSACGATFCYLLSHFFGRTLIMTYCAERVKPLQKLVQDNLEGLFFFLLFLRLFPMSPNWFLNMASPILDVPVVQFFLSVFVGLMPYNFICVQTGSLLSEISSIKDVLTTATMLKLATMAIVALLPGILFRKQKAKMN